MVFSLSILAFATATLALPSGAPKCKINETVVTKGHGTQQSLGYSFAVTPSPTGNSYQIAIVNPSKSDMAGILLYMTSTSKPINHHLGKFSLPDQRKWKYQTQAACQAGEIVQDPTGTVTHATGDSVALSQSIFTWTPKPEEVALIPSIQINAIVSAAASSSAIKSASGLRKRVVGADGAPAWQHLALTTLLAVGSGKSSDSPSSSSLTAGSEKMAPVTMPSSTASSSAYTDASVVSNGKDAVNETQGSLSTPSTRGAPPVSCPIQPAAAAAGSPPPDSNTVSGTATAPTVTNAKADGHKGKDKGKGGKGKGGKGKGKGAKAGGGSAAGSAPSTAASTSAAGSSASLLAQHNTLTDCWVSFNAKVYDLTAFVTQHPGGQDVFTSLCGTDGFQAAFEAKHKGKKDAKFLGVAKVIH